MKYKKVWILNYIIKGGLIEGGQEMRLRWTTKESKIAHLTAEVKSLLEF